MSLGAWAARSWRGDSRWNSHPGHPFPRAIDTITVSEPRVVPTQEGYDLLWAQSYDDEDNTLIALETTLVRWLLGDVRGL
jgi:hypothetical protein